jgi:hypothetical protein
MKFLTMLCDMTVTRCADRALLLLVASFYRQVDLPTGVSISSDVVILVKNAYLEGHKICILYIFNN